MDPKAPVLSPHVGTAGTGTPGTGTGTTGTTGTGTTGIGHHSTPKKPVHKKTTKPTAPGRTGTTKKPKPTKPGATTPRSSSANDPISIGADNAIGPLFVGFDSDKVDACTMTTGRQAALLPISTLTTPERSAGAALDYDGQESVTLAFDRGIKLYPAVTTVTGIQPGSGADLIGRREDLYAIENGASRLKSRAMDGVLLTQGFGTGLVSLASNWLRAQLLSPTLTVTERETLMGNWSPFLALLEKEQQHQAGIQQRSDLETGKVSAKADAAAQHTDMLHVVNDLQQKQPVPEDTLLAAAQEYARQMPTSTADRVPFATSTEPLKTTKRAAKR